MFIKSLISIVLASVTFSALAAPELPFVGTRIIADDYNHAMDSETKITIKKNGSVTIKTCGPRYKNGCYYEYRGPFKSLIPVQFNYATKGIDTYYKITTTKFYYFDKFKKPDADFPGGDLIKE